MTPSRKLIWILEDDADSRRSFESYLQDIYELRFFDFFEDTCNAVEKCSPSERPDLIIANMKLPEANFMKSLNSRSGVDGKFFAPFIVISEIEDITVIRHCFTRGALDYITKPLSKTNLLVKLEVIFSEFDPHILSNLRDNFMVDPITLRVHFNQRETTPLTSKEFQLLSLFRLSSEKSVSRIEMINRIWKDMTITAKTLDVHLFNLRKKLSEVNLEIVFTPPNVYRLVSTSPKSDPLDLGLLAESSALFESNLTGSSGALASQKKRR